MAKQYEKIRLWKADTKIFKLKVENMNKDLKLMGVKKRIPLTRVFHYMVNQPIVMDDTSILKKLANRKYKI